MAYLRLLSLLVVLNLIGTLGLPTSVAADTNLPIGLQAQIMYTGGDGVRMRESTSVESDTLKVLEEGWRVTVLKGPITDDDGAVWYKVGHSGTTGHVLAQYLAIATGETGGLMPSESAMVFTDDGAPLRLRETVSGDVLMVMPHGGTTLVLDGPSSDSESRRWYQVKYDGTAGWALGAYLRPVEYVAASHDTTTRSAPRSAPAATPVPVAPAPPASAPSAPPAPAPAPPRAAGGGNAAMASIAREFIGYPYAWGGSSPAGFDCSGLVRYVAMRALGISLGRDVYAQIGAGVAVSASDLRPGDLVFFKDTYRWGLSHVSIYLGSGQVVSAQSESTGVRIQNMWDNYWGPRYYAARRL